MNDTRTSQMPSGTAKTARTPESIAEPTTMPCMQCGGKGTFLIVEKPRETGVGRPWRYVYENSIHNSNTVMGAYVDHYFCGACDGKGVVDVPGVKR